MEDNRLAQAITFATKRTFEDMAFVDVSRLRRVPIVLSGVSVSRQDGENILHNHILSISYVEPESGEILLILPSGCVKMIVENIYGQDWESLVHDEISDCLLEIMNVLAGNFLKIFYNRTGHQHASFPKIITNTLDLHGIEKHNTFYFNAEGEHFKVCLRI